MHDIISFYTIGLAKQTKLTFTNKPNFNIEALVMASQ